MFGSLKSLASLGSGYSETNNGFHYLIARALNSPIDSPHAPHGQASVNQRGRHLCWNETLLALRFDASPRPRSGCVESIGDCLQRFPFAPRMRTGDWMLDTFMRLAPMQILLDRGLSQADVLDRRLSHDTWASYWLDGALGTCLRPTRDSARLHPCRQAAYFLPCTRPPDTCGSCLDRPRHRRPQGSRDRTQARAFVITRADRHRRALPLSASSGAFSSSLYSGEQFLLWALYSSLSM